VYDNRFWSKNHRLFPFLELLLLVKQDSGNYVDQKKIHSKQPVERVPFLGYIIIAKVLITELYKHNQGGFSFIISFDKNNMKARRRVYKD
jgi:hypothetical protein